MMVFNTLGRRREEFVPLHDNIVRMYVCGPTVYDYIHIGNARAFIVADVVRHYLEYKGFKVKFVTNVTDIDDKTIKRANETGLSVQQLGEAFSDAYFEDMARLNLKKPDVNPRATQHIPEIIGAVEVLIEKGYAYESDGDVYFEVSKFEEYGKLSGNKAEALKMGARIEVNPKKRHPADFALWKAWKPGEPAWHSLWGKGRPGWHIECSTMATKYLGETFDIHMGGKDLIFPHHENEIAQAEAATGKPFAKYWLHNEWLTVDGKKMSKSLRNFVTVRQALKTCEPMVLRFFLLSSHYRTPIDFNTENLRVAEMNLKRIFNAVERFDFFAERKKRTSEEERLLSEAEEAERRFERAMNDDFNTRTAIFAVLGLVKAVNVYMEKNAEIEASAKKKVSETLRRLLDVLGIETGSEEARLTRTSLMKGLLDLILDLRQKMRERKDWETADEIRNRLQELGLAVEDTPERPKLKTRKAG
ncbi:MAG: cysteine--tRNA ligase [Candidatus Bathyarchaeota archaeon]|nr:cysteine--tRNA ligase [Candidatus Bathyarchaeota archaeon]